MPPRRGRGKGRGRGKPRAKAPEPEPVEEAVESEVEAEDAKMEEVAGGEAESGDSKEEESGSDAESMDAEAKDEAGENGAEEMVAEPEAKAGEAKAEAPKAEKEAKADASDASDDEGEDSGSEREADAKGADPKAKEEGSDGEDEEEGAETDGESEEETAEPGGENEDAGEDSDSEGDAAEESPPPSPPSRGRRRKRAATPEPAPEDDEAEETPTPSRRRRRRKSGERGDSPPALPDHLRCRRSDGKKWRCSGRALPTVSFCEYHYTKANKSKKLPADGEILAVALQRQKNKRKGRKSINTPASPQATTSNRQTRDLPNGLMTISPGSSGAAALSSPVTTKVGVEIPAPIRRCYRSKNAEPLPVGPVKVVPRGMSMTKSVPRTCHRCGLTKSARVANCKNCEKNFCNSCINKWYSEMSRKDIKTRCPVCRGLCDCKKCALGQTKGTMRKESPTGEGKILSIKISNHQFYKLLPVKLDQEQLDELELEAKIQGTKISDVRVQVAENGQSESLYWLSLA
nr:unnamed protein product [Digitaria exilis]